MSSSSKSGPSGLLINTDYYGFNTDMYTVCSQSGVQMKKMHTRKAKRPPSRFTPDLWIKKHLQIVFVLIVKLPFWAIRTKTNQAVRTEGRTMPNAISPFLNFVETGDKK